jgi:DNA-binding transcriptional MocR family regulator
VAAKQKFTRIPKIPDLIKQGIPAEVIPTYCALTDYANNKTGLCWPKMETLAETLNRSVRTIQRHLHQLKELGLIEFVQRRRRKGRFSSYLYRVLHIVHTTGHGKPVDRTRPNRRRTKPSTNPPKSPSKNLKEGYEWLFGEDPPPDAQQDHDAAARKRREEEAKRRTEGYEWLFK